MELLIDLLVALTLFTVAARALTSRDPFRAVVLFVVLGLLSSLAWVRLGALDVALAEAAIGAGLTGALLLDAVRGIALSARPQNRTPPGKTVGR